MKVRLRHLFCILGFLAASGLVQANDPENVCVHLAFSVLATDCSAESIWLDLRESRRERPKVSISDITLSVGGDVLARANALWTEGFVPPGRSVAPWPFALPVDWNADPFEDRNWRFQFHAWRMIDPLIAAWERTHDESHFRASLDVMRDWYAYHFGASRKTSDFQWYDMSVGLRAMKLAYVLSQLLHEDLVIGEQDPGVLIHLASLHAESLMDPRQLSSGNHGLFQLHGLMAVCSVLPELKHCAGYEEYVEREMRDLVSRQFSSEGIHLEHSPAYHFFAYNVISRLLKSGWYDDYPEIADRMKKARENRVWMIHPDKTMVTVGDSRPTNVSLDFPDGDAKCHNEFLRVPDCYHLQTFPESGYAIVRSDWAVPLDASSMLFFMASFHSSSHKLPDDLSFEWFEAGGRILTNSGVYSYNRDLWRDYVRSTRAHNTVEIDGRSSSVFPYFAYGSAILGTRQRGDIFFLNGSVSRNDLEAVHDRAIVYAPARWLVVHDAVEMEMPASITQWFHFSPDIEIEETRSGHMASRSDGARILIESNARQVEIAYGQEKPYVQGWVTRSYGEMEPRYSLGMNHVGIGARMITYFALSEKDLEDARRTVTGLLN